MQSSVSSHLSDTKSSKTSWNYHFASHHRSAATKLTPKDNKTGSLQQQSPFKMRLMGRFLLRVLEVMTTPGPNGVGPPWMMILPQDHMPPTKITDKDSASDTSKKNIDPNDRDSWSWGPDLLWLHNTQDKNKKTVRSSFLRDLPYSTKHWPCIDLPEGRVHISRYFP